METTLRLEAVRRTAFDDRLARLGGGRLTRAGGFTYLESDDRIEDATHQLALAGIRVTPCSGVPSPATGLRRAVVFDLAPLGETIQAVDVVEVRQVALGDATTALMRRRFPPFRRSRAARDACRRLLRDEDAILGWRRILWCSVSSLREARAQVRLRAVVFDAEAVERQRLRWSYVSDAAIERWAFA